MVANTHLSSLQSSPHRSDVFFPGVFSVLYPRLHTDMLTNPDLASEYHNWHSIISHQQLIRSIDTLSQLRLSEVREHLKALMRAVLQARTLGGWIKCISRTNMSLPRMEPKLF